MIRVLPTVPPSPLLDAVEDWVSPFVESLWKSEADSRTIAALRDTLLPKLIFGDLRLSHAEGTPEVDA